MGFTLEPQREQLYEKAIKGHYKRVSVLCWFTSEGKSMPLRVRCTADDGAVYEISQIQNISSEQRHYAGILAQRYDCRAEINGYLRDFILLFHPEDNTWDLIHQD